MNKVISKANDSHSPALGVRGFVLTGALVLSVFSMFHKLPESRNNRVNCETLKTHVRLKTVFHLTVS